MADEVKKDVDTSNLSDASKKVLESVEKMSVLELAELVKVMEQKFGVSAAAPMAMAAGGAGAGAVEEAGDGKVSVELTSAGGQKISVIKIIREITGLGLKEAKDMVDGAPKIVKEKIEKKEAEDLKKKIEETGATVTIK